MGRSFNPSVSRLSAFVLCIGITLIILACVAHSALYIPTPTTPRITYIQAGAFKNDELAASLGSQLFAEGYPAHTLAGNDFHRVLIGPFYAKEEARSVLSGLLERGYEGWIRDDLQFGAGSVQQSFLKSWKHTESSGSQPQGIPAQLTRDHTLVSPAVGSPVDQSILGRGPYRNAGATNSFFDQTKRTFAPALFGERYDGADNFDSPQGAKPSHLQASASQTFGTQNRTPDNRRRLQLLKARYCDACHSGKLAGTVLPVLDRPAGRGLSPAAVTAALWNHGPTMWRTLGPKEMGDPPASMRSLMRDLYVQFLALRFYDPPGDAARGKRVYVSKGCIRCHGLANEQNGVGSAIPIRRAVLDRARMLSKLWDHSALAASEMKRAGITWKKLRPQEMVDLLVYLDNSPAQPGQEPELTVGDAEAGRAIFQRQGCLGCHGSGGRGDSGVNLFDDGGHAPQTRSLFVKILLFQWLAGPRKPQGAATAASLGHLAAEMWNHRAILKSAGASPAVSFSRVEEMQHLLAYLFAKGYFFRVRGNERRGQNVFRKKRCDQCHAQSDTVAGSASQPDRVSQVQMGLGPWSHDPSAMAAMQKPGTKWATLTSRNIEDLLESFKGKLLSTSIPNRHRPADRLVVQVGAFETAGLADSFAGQLVGRGYSPKIISAKDLSRVVVGPFSDEAQALQIVDRLKSDGYSAFVKSK